MALLFLTARYYQNSMNSTLTKIMLSLIKTRMAAMKKVVAWLISGLLMATMSTCIECYCITKLLYLKKLWPWSGITAATLFIKAMHTMTYFKLVIENSSPRFKTSINSIFTLNLTPVQMLKLSGPTIKVLLTNTFLALLTGDVKYFLL